VIKLVSAAFSCLALLLSVTAQEVKPGPPSPKPAPPPPKVTYIKAGRLFDSTGDSYKTNMVIVVEGDRIKGVSPAASARIPAGAEVIDLSNATVLPGLLDCHTHIGGRADRYDPIYTFRESPFASAFAAVVNARTTLLAGFTTIRDLGGEPFLAVDLRKSIEEGFVAGPRIVAAGPGISITGGHGDLNNVAPQVSVKMFAEQNDYGIADGSDQVRKVTRAQLKYGADVIKILATGGVLSKNTSPGASQFTVEELRAAAEEAHARGKKIAAHAHGAEGIKNAIRAGIDSIEHASLIDDEGIRMAKEHGTYLDMDIYNDDYLLSKAIEFGLEQENIDKEKEVGQKQRDNFQKAVRAGVKMAFGTDAGVYPHGDNARQFAYMLKYGMTPAQAIRTATIDSATLLDRQKDIGTIEAGKFADIIAVSGDPLADVRVLEKVDFVMKGGRVYKQGGAPKI
jgi:imidazolonepropionase-like amidohydrolase